MTSSIERTASPTPPGSQDPGDTWLGGASLPAEHHPEIQRHIRELSTTDDLPTAPRLDLLFGRGGVPPQQTAVIWDPAGRWPGFSMQAVATAGSGELTEIRLMRKGRAEPLVTLEHTLLRPGPTAIGVLQVHAKPASPVALQLALSLLEQADRALLLAGNSSDNDLVRQIRRLLPDHQWSGPRLMLVSPGDMPSRGQRLRRLNWPAGMPFTVLEKFRSNAPEWSVDLIEQVTAAGRPAPARTDEPHAGDHGPDPSAPQPAPMKDTVNPQPATRRSKTSGLAVAARAEPAPSNLPTGAFCDQALAVLGDVPGMRACSVIDSTSRRLLAQRGEPALVRSSADAASRLRASFDGGHAGDGTRAALGELSWSAGACEYLAWSLPAHPSLMVLAVVDRELGDIGHARWHMTVARNHFA